MRIGLTCTLRRESAGDDGWNDTEEEFDSEDTVRRIAAGLAALGHDVEVMGDGEPLMRRLLDGPRPDLVFNIAEGRGASRNREAWVPALLESMGIPYTGSDPLTLSVTLDKDVAKRVVAQAGVETPRCIVVDGEVDAAALSALRFPVIVKPSFEGSSKGIVARSVVENADDLLRLVRELRGRYSQPVLAEEYIDGDELTVGMVGGSDPVVLGILRVIPRRREGRFVYGLEMKRNWREEIIYEAPARLSDSDRLAVESAACRAWKALGCRDVSRVDFRLRDGVAYFIEVNPLPGLNPESGDIVLLSRGNGISYEALLRMILETASARLGMG